MHFLYFALAIKANAIEMYTCKAIDSTYIRPFFKSNTFWITLKYYVCSFSNMYNLLVGHDHESLLSVLRYLFQRHQKMHSVI